MDIWTTTPIDAGTDSALRAMLDEQAAAWNRRDALNWGQPFSEDADFVSIRGRVFCGRAAIIEQHARIFAGPFRGSRTHVEIRRMVQIAPGIVLVDATHEVTNFTFLPPSVTATSDGVLRTSMKYIAIGHSPRWEIVSAQNTAVLPGVDC
jgi:uncharacterized protein (TIGR02246 family)